MNLRRIIQEFIRTQREFIQYQLEGRRIHDSLDTVDTRRLYQEVHENAEPCFVLSTGRCGTQLLNDIFNVHNQLKSYHNPVPELIYYSGYAYQYHTTRADELSRVVDAARYEYIRDTYLLGKHFMETNNRITFFAYQLAELYPRARFIHVIRNPLDFVRSGLGREWYSGNHPHDEGRIVPGENQAIDWDGYSLVKKIAWLWDETNRFIEGFKEGVDPKRLCTITAEHLFSSVADVERIFQFLEVDSLPVRKIRKHLRRPANVSRRSYSLDSADQNEIQQVISRSSIAEKYGYGYS